MSRVLCGQAFVAEYGMPSSSKSDAVDAGPFLRWLDRWQLEQGRERGARGYSHGDDTHGGRSPAGMTVLTELAGVSERAVRRARANGRVSRCVVDRMLIAAGGNTMLFDLYPED